MLSVTERWRSNSDDVSHPPRHCRLHDLAPGGHEHRRRRREHDRPGDRPGPIGQGQMRRSGNVTLHDEDPSSSMIEAVIDAASVDTSEPKRDAHLRSADFLDVTRYPTIAFRSTRIERADGGHWRVTGDLTLLGRTRPVLLDVDSSTSEGTPPSAHA